MLFRLIAALINSVVEAFGRSPGAMIPDGNGGITPVPKPKGDEEPRLIEPGYLKKARSYIGIKESPGAAATAQILSFFAKAGHPGIKSDETAWCAAFANACLEEAGYSGTKQLNARSFLTWGKEVKKPYPGAVTVFWRNSPDSWEGHVAFFLEEDATRVRVLGGNQSNQVSSAWYPKSQVLGYRTPPTMAGSRTGGAVTADLLLSGLSGTLILDSQGEITGIAQLVREIGVSVPAFLVGSLLVCIALKLVVMYARYDDLKTRGR